MAQTAWNSFLVTVLAILGTGAVTLLTSLFFNQEISPQDGIVSFIMPALIACPLSVGFFHQSGKLQQQNRELALKASQDQMTGLWNRATFFEHLSRMERTGTSYAVLVIDVDHFKYINDRYGHAEGDRALVTIASALKTATRKTDVVARVGGEEFAVILIGATDNEALIVADRIRSGVEAENLVTIAGLHVPLTVSIGGTLCERGNSSQDVMRVADERLYDAKRTGRNRVVFGFPDRRTAAA